MTYRYDGHGHSRMSDGRDTPERIVATAVQRGVHILGLSDHDTVAGLPAFLRACEEMNSHGQKILPIPSIEVTTTAGHLLIALPYVDDAWRFIADFPLWKVPADPSDVLTRCINDYRALCIFVHPQARSIDGCSLPAIDAILSAVSLSLRPFVGIEIHNWMAGIFFWKRSDTEHIIEERNEIWHLTQCAFTDYHQAGHVGNYATLMEMPQLSAEAFVDAFVGRRMQLQTTQSTARQRIEAYVTVFHSETIGRIRRKLNSKSKAPSSK